MAAFIEQEFEVETGIEPGQRKEFSVWVDRRKVASRSLFGMPGDRRIRWAVRWALRRG